MKTSQRIKKAIISKPRGKLISTTKLVKYGPRTSVDKALSRLTKSGEITRVTRGIYVRPKENRFVGKTMPSPIAVIKEIATNTGEIIQVNGAEAARQFGFSTQVPAQPTYLTTGRSRNLTIGALEIHLKHTSNRKIPLPGTKAGIAIAALWYLGKNQVSTTSIHKIKTKLAASEFKKFVNAKEKMPAWMANTVLQFEQEDENE